MEYCSLSDAFPEVGGGPASTGCKGNEAGAVARREERKKAKRCKGPPLTFLEAPSNEPVVDPDRPALRPKPDTPPMNPATGLLEHAPVDAPPAEPFQDFAGGTGPGANVRSITDLVASFRSEQADPKQERVLDTLPKVAGPTKQQPSKLPSYFGANYDMDTPGNILAASPRVSETAVEEGFASFTSIIGDDPSYRLEPDFTQSFSGKGLEKASGVEVLPIPSVQNVWKPLTPGGASTAFYDRLPLPGGTVVRETQASSADFDKEVLFRRLDQIYARLDDLESRKGEQSQKEVLLFVMSGLFVLFSMDLLVRRTGNVRVLRR
jgi:hypothetical protein